MKSLIFTIFLSLFFSACAGKKELLIKTEYIEVKVPIKCDLKLPLKPQFNGNFKSAKELSAYYLQVEKIAKICTKTEQN